MEIIQCENCRYKGHLWKGRVYCTVHKSACMKPTDFCSKGKPKDSSSEKKDE